MTARCFFIGTTLADNPVSHHFTALAAELVRRGHRVVLLAPHRRVELENPTGNPAIYTWPSDRPTRLVDARFLNALIRQYRPDCLIANFVAVNVMTLVGRWAGVPQRVAWYHTLSTQIAMDGQAPAWRQWLLHRRKSLVYAACTHVVPVSQAAGQDFSQTYPGAANKVRVWLNSIGDPGRTEAPAADAARVVCVGRLNASKGQDVLLRAVARLQKKYPALRVEFIGDGPALAAFTALAGELGVSGCCEFVGRVGHVEVLRRMAGATVTVVPSRSEAFALVTIESLAVGTPVVASRTGGLPEIVRDGVDGFLVPPDDPPTLAEKLDGLLADAALQSQMRAAARAGFLDRFDLRQTIPRQADWLEEITG